MNSKHRQEGIARIVSANVHKALRAEEKVTVFLPSPARLAEAEKGTPQAYDNSSVLTTIATGIAKTESIPSSEFQD